MALYDSTIDKHTQIQNTDGWLIGVGERGNGKQLFNGYRFPMGVIKRFGFIQRWWLKNIDNILSHTELVL